MKAASIIVIMFTIMIGISSCYTKENSPTNENALPTHFQKMGEAFTLEIRQTVNNLNKLPLNYSDIKSTTDLKELFYKDYLTAHPAKTKSKNITNLLHLLGNKDVLNARINNLTSIQLEFIEQILKEADSSFSCWNFLDRLVKINQNIKIDVPQIEQDRLFLITTYLYYGLKEIYTLEKNGLMPIFNKNDIGTKMPDEGWIDGKWCRKVLSTVWVIALEEPTFIGETIASVATVVIGGILLYEYLVCKDSNPDDVIDNTNMGIEQMCQEYYRDCTNHTPNLDCSTCLHNCLVQGLWPEWMCARRGNQQ